MERVTRSSTLIERSFFAGMAVTILGLMVIAAVQFRSAPSRFDDAAQAAHSEQVLTRANDLSMALQEADAVASDLSPRAATTHSIDLETQVDNVRLHARAIQTIADRDPHLRPLINRLNPLLERHLHEIRLKADGKIGRDEATVAADELRFAIRELVSEERDALEANRVAIETGWRRFRLLTEIGLMTSLTSIAVSIVLMLYWRRRQQIAEKHLSAEQLLMAEILRRIPVGVYFKDKNLRFGRVSESFAKMVGARDASHLEGKTIFDLLDKAEAEKEQQRDQELLASGRTAVSEERELISRAGPRWIFSSTSVLYDDRKQPMGLLGVEMDITARKNAEKTQEDASERLGDWVRQLQQWNDSERTLAELGEMLQTCSSEAEAGEIIGRYLPDLFPGVSGYISLTKPSRDLVEPLTKWGTVGKPLVAFSPQECWALRRGRVHESGPGRIEPICDHGTENRAQRYCIPMMARGESLGVFHASFPGSSISDFQRRFLGVSAERIGLALANLRLRRQLEDLSLRDPLTGLFNRRYLEEAGQQSLHRCGRHGRPASLVMVDIDHFKVFNDRYGHEAGDALLQAFGELLRTRMRQEDLVCRYGGEEFTIIFPELAPDEAERCLERLRKWMRELVVTVNGNKLGPVTASFGVAGYPRDGIDLAALIREADQCLYRAKNTGRDRVVVAGTFDSGENVVAIDEAALPS